MKEIIVNNIIDNFEEYIKTVKEQDFLYSLFTNNNLCKVIIDNDLYWKNIMNISIRFGSDKTFEMFKLLSMKDNDKKLLNENMHIIFNYDYFDKDFLKQIFEYIESKQIMDTTQISNLINHILLNKCSYINYNAVDYLLNSKYKNIIKDNFEFILSNCYYLFDVKEIIKEDSDLLNRFNYYINTNPDNLIYEMLIKGFNFELEVIKNEKIFDTIKIIINELLEHENLNYSDINFLGMGATSYVVSIGSKVLKLGEKREVFKMENNKRFLKPILRTEIDSITSDEVLGCIEITEKVNIKDITEADLYILYKELRDKGYIWLDCNINNVGKLIKRNKIHYQNLNPKSETVNYIGESNEELPEGELVIIDNDYIFHEEDIKNDLRLCFSREFDRFEARYQEEVRRRSK